MYAHFRYAKCLFTDIQKQQNTLKSNFLKQYRLSREFLRLKLRNFQGIIFIAMNINIQEDFQICIVVPLRYYPNGLFYSHLPHFIFSFLIYNCINYEKKWKNRVALISPGLNSHVYIFNFQDFDVIVLSIMTPKNVTCILVECFVVFFVNVSGVLFTCGS